MVATFSLQLFQQGLGVFHKGGYDGGNIGCLVGVVGVGCDVALVAENHPGIHVVQQTAFATSAHQFAKTHGIHALTVRQVKFKAAFEHLPTELEAVFKALDAGITQFFVLLTRRMPAGDGTLQRCQGGLK
ncbi:MAG: hypothetical protein M0P52_15275 [Rhodoferax sp.]|nr:hypothetical protein [Rhodoferax sp.]